MKILTIWSIIFWLLASPVPLPAQEDHSHEPESQNTTDNRALLVKISSHFFLNRKTWIEVLTTFLIAGTAVMVSLAGHLGSQLVCSMK
ncbi:MAG: hypothetical protein ACOCX8_01335 [Bacteroidota bacterium]